MCRADKKRETGICPKCGGDNTSMEDFEMDKKGN